MNRRQFISLSGAAGAALAGSAVAQGQEFVGRREVYELRRYEIETEAQEAALLAFMAEAAIPALNRIGIEPVGVFQPAEEMSPVFVLLTHPSIESVGTMTQRLLADEEFTEAGADFLDAPADNPAYARVESQLLLAFQGMPRIERPVDNPERVLQLRIYESPSIRTGQKKIEMFNTAEIAIFRKTGLAPVFFGESLVGSAMPNLTYMLAFESQEAREAAWQTFINHPEWQELRAKPEYEDKKILCGITNLFLRAAECSQI